MIAGIGRVQSRLALRVRGPVKTAAVDNQTADRVAMPAEIFRRRVHNNSGTVIERPRQERRRSIVNDQRDTERTADSRNLGNRKHHQLRIWQGLGIVGPGPFIGGPPEIFRIDRIDETNFDTLILERVGEQIPCPSVKVGRAHDIVARTSKILDRKCRGRLA